MRPFVVELLHELVKIYALDRMMIAPPALSPIRLAALRKALDEVMVDQEFRRNMEKILRPVDYMPGAETERFLAGIVANENRIKPLVLQVLQGSK